MNQILRDFLAELGGLFVDDGSLALFAAVLIAVIAGAVKLAGVPPLWGAVALLVGLLGILLESLTRASKPGRKR
jgi:hypothetical protein